METQRRRLHRSRTDKRIAGVCGGVAEWLRWDPTVVRLGFVLLSIVSAAFPGILVYLLLWLITPVADASPPPPGQSPIQGL